MVLVDTSIWIDHFRKANPQLQQLLKEMKVMSHLSIIGELACGCVPARAETLLLLDRMPKAISPIHAEMLYFIDEYGLSGQGLGWVDVQLLAAARISKVQLWTKDRALNKVAQELNLAF